MDNKEKILEIANEQFMQFGLRSVSMDDIAKKCGMSKKTIYVDFSSKELLIKELVKILLDKNEDFFNSIHKANSNAIMSIYRTTEFVVHSISGIPKIVLYDMQKYYRNVWEYLRERQYDLSLKNIEYNISQGIREGLYRKEINADFVKKVYVELNLAISNGEIFPTTEYERADLFKLLFDYHMRALVTDKGREIINKIEL